MSRAEAFWVKLMQIGSSAGCHQMPERSLFWRGYQFPVCARCTGVFFGYILAVPLWFFYKPSIWVALLGAAVMFLDWLFQRLKIALSNNFRRLFTGLLGGYGLMNMIIFTILRLFQVIKK